jgi:hypothetical protein
MSPFVILVSAQAVLFMMGAAVAPSYAGSSNGDGITIVKHAHLPQAQDTPDVPGTASVQLDNGDVVTVKDGDMILIQRDPDTGAYQIGMKEGQ